MRRFKLRYSIYMVLISILLLGDIAWTENQKMQNSVNDPSSIKPVFPLKAPQIGSSIQFYTPHAPIFIQGDEDFITQATTNNWIGEGTIANPIIIEGYTITALEGSLIYISDTILYFIIRNNLLNGSNAAAVGIHFSNVLHGTIENNIICNTGTTDGGIIFENSCSHNLIINNSIFGNGMGINVHGKNNRIVNNIIYKNEEVAISCNIGTFNNTIVGNIIYNNSDTGIQLEQSNSNLISNNTVYGSEVNGIDLVDSSGNSISNNTIYNTVLAISFHNSSNNRVSNNYIFDNDGGINLYYSSGNSFMNNTTLANYNVGVYLSFSCNNNTFIANQVIQNGMAGIFLFESNYNYFTENLIVRNLYEGLNIEGDTNFNIFSFNNFTDNYAPQHQAKDGGSNNMIVFNYWNDWITPDFDADGFVDTPYSIKGVAGNQDFYPLTSLALDHDHLVLSPIIVHPEGGETLNGVITLDWMPAIDSLKHNMTYSVYYSSNLGKEWILLAHDIQNTYYEWDTTTVDDSSNYMIKIEVKCSKGLTVIQISITTFTIDNVDNVDAGGNQFVNLLIIAFFTLLFIIGLGYLLYTSKLKVPTTIIDFFQNDQIDFLKSVYGKVIIGLENIQSGVITELQATPLLEPVEPTTLVEYFPSDIRDDLTSGLKGRTVLTLIEIAYQHPEETNPMRLAKTLDIPPTTISYEINRLIELEYLKPFVSPQVLKDGRFRNYIITPKGASFLRILKGALELSIRRLREKEVDQLSS